MFCKAYRLWCAARDKDVEEKEEIETHDIEEINKKVIKTVEKVNKGEKNSSVVSKC